MYKFSKKIQLFKINLILKEKNHKLNTICYKI